MKLPTDRTAVASINRSNHWPKNEEFKWFDYLGTLGLNDESSWRDLSHELWQKIRRIYFSNCLYMGGRGDAVNLADKQLVDVSDLQYGLQKDDHVKPLCCCMTHYKNIRPTLISWIDWSLHPQTTATHFLSTMQASGHIGDVTLVEVVFINFVNKGCGFSRGSAQEHRMWLIRREALFICPELVCFSANLWSTLIPSAMQPHASGGAKSEEASFVNASKPEACLPKLCGGGRRALPPPSDGCHGDPGPSWCHQRRAALNNLWFQVLWCGCSPPAPVPRRQGALHLGWV